MPTKTATPAATEELLGGKQIHPLAAMFPPMTADEFAALCQDIEANGLVEPIVLLEGKILDGTHRLRACIEKGIKPRYVEWKGEGGTSVQFVWSKNELRRHLTAGQRAVIALTAEREFAKEARSRMSPKGRSAQGVERIPHLSKARALAGRLTGVNDRYVQDAKVVEKSNPGLLEQVRLGQMTLPVAKRQATMSDTPAANANPHQAQVQYLRHVLRGEWLVATEGPLFTIT